MLSFTGKALCWSISWRCYSLLFNVFGITAHRLSLYIFYVHTKYVCPLHSPSLSAPRRSVRMKRTCPTVSRAYERASHKTLKTQTHTDVRLETSKYVAHGWMRTAYQTRTRPQKKNGLNLIVLVVVHLPVDITSEHPCPNSVQSTTSRRCTESECS